MIDDVGTMVEKLIAEIRLLRAFVKAYDDDDFSDAKHIVVAEARDSIRQFDEGK